MITKSRNQEDNIYLSDKDLLLSTGYLKEGEHELLQLVSKKVAAKDNMYLGNDQHYLSVGLSAIRVIQSAFEKLNYTTSVTSILDFPCGYGRVLRFLKAKFPNAEITISEIDLDALSFCRKEFSVQGIPSDKDTHKIEIKGKFDLIWCGSLITHLDDRSTQDLIHFFGNHLASNGVCVFTTHGQTSVKWIETETKSYGLDKDSQHRLINKYFDSGYGFVEYKDSNGYGISVVNQVKMTQMIKRIKAVKEIFFKERGWDNHQDVFAFSKI